MILRRVLCFELRLQADLTLALVAYGFFHPSKNLALAPCLSSLKKRKSEKRQMGWNEERSKID